MSLQSGPGFNVVVSTNNELQAKVVNLLREMEPTSITLVAVSIQETTDYLLHKGAFQHLSNPTIPDLIFIDWSIPFPCVLIEMIRASAIHKTIPIIIIGEPDEPVSINGVIPIPFDKDQAKEEIRVVGRYLFGSVIRPNVTMG